MLSSKLIRRILIVVLPVVVLSGTAMYLWKTSIPVKKSRVSITEDNRFLLDTVVSIRLYNSGNPDNLSEAFDLIDGYEQLLSRHREGSDPSRINNTDAGTPVTVSSETVELMTAGLNYAAMSGGRFDPSVGPLVDLWDIGGETARVPDPEEIAEVLSLVDYRSVQVDTGTGTVTLEKKGMTVDLGGIAKGWIADRIAVYLREQGEEHILINLGGNVLVSGGKPDGVPFKIGMQNPFADRGEYLGIFSLADGSVVSSGIYERFLESGGIRYHHILDTESGYPVNNGLAAVTVISERSVDGDALSTTLFALGIEKGLELVSRLSGVDAAFITDDNRIVMTAGAAQKFEAASSDFQVEIRD